MKINNLISCLLILAVFLAIMGFLSDLRNTFQYAGVDLRNRVVGSRLLQNEIDPYFYKWRENDPVTFLDPRDDPGNQVNRVTVTPAVLQLFLPLSKLKYSTIRIIWLFLQWCFLLITINVFSRIADSQTASSLIWICGLFFVGSSFFWRLHVERGQIYIFYIMIFSFFCYAFQKKQKLLSGLILGFLIVLRPPYVLVLLPLAFVKNRKVLFYTGVGALSTLLLSIAFSGWEVWSSYFQAMTIHGQIHMIDVKPPTISYPYTNIEGMGDLYALANLPIYDSSVQFLLRSVGIVIGSNSLKLILLLVLAVTSFWLYKSHRKFNDTKIIIIASLLVFMAEFFIPAARYSYNNVLILIPISLVIIELEKN